MKRSQPLRAICLLLVFLLAGTAVVRSEEKPAARPFPPAWQQHLDAAVAAGETPGAMVLIKTPDWGVRIGTAGFADVEAKQEMAPNLRWRVGDVSTTLASIAYYALDQRDQLRLNVFVADFLPEDTIRNAKHMAIRDLLVHSSGLYPPRLNPAFCDPQDGKPPVWGPELEITAEELLEYCVSPEGLLMFSAGDMDLNPWKPYWRRRALLAGYGVRPSQMHYYSSGNIILVAKLMEAVTKKPYAEILRAEVLEPLGMEDTFSAVGEDKDRHDGMLRGYERPAVLREEFHLDPKKHFKIHTADKARWADVTPWNQSYRVVSGDVVSTVWDLLAFAESVFRDDRVLTDAGRRKWLNYTVATPWFSTVAYGVGGVYRWHSRAGILLGHVGVTQGYATAWFYCPTSDSTVIACANTSKAAIDKLSETVMALAQHAPGSPRPANRTTDVARGDQGTVALSWTNGLYYGESFQIYLGTDLDSVEEATAKAADGVKHATAQATRTSFKDLAANTTYYWRVDAVQKDGSLVPSPTWSFRTGK